ncbi:MAG TPA: DUF1569 domain-containing protein [Planctomycetaceae bacterium]|jgi:hypothetical protein|nr:DUF1569 domain-containing protein [Planctomycetaceae bacterium]
MTIDACDREAVTRLPLSDAFRQPEPEAERLDTTRGAIETRRVKNRRDVRFCNFDEFLAEADRLANGPARLLGTWTLAQIFDHLARSMDVSVDGTNERFPWPLRITLRLVRTRIIGTPMKPGYRVPENVAVLLRPDPHVGLRESLWKLRSAAIRFQDASAFPPHPAFGALTRDEYRSLALRHAELHLSFVEPIRDTLAGTSSSVPSR